MTVQTNGATSVSYTLGANVEKLVLIGTAALNGSGNNLANTLTGNAGANVLDGKTGADVLLGGVGNDTYIVDNVGDIVSESSTLATEVDTVQSSVSFTLTANVEKLVLTGNTSVNGTGNSLANTLTGNSANNLLNGMGGADTMTGGLGHDIYVINNIGDVIIETSTISSEADTVQSSISYTLGENLERLVLTGGSNLSGTGNSLRNILTGNNGSNILNGGAGVDILIGGLGNDSYLVDNTGDRVVEDSTLATEIDIVQSSVSFTLGINIEKLVLNGTGALNGVGNSLANTLTGNSANNLLNGMGGADTMTGGVGNDSYLVDDLNDVVVETSKLVTEVDTVLSSVSYTLTANVEKLVLIGSGAINGSGNSLANTLTGNTGNNVLNGGLGNDTYIFSAGVDTIVENDSTSDNTDVLNVLSGVANDQLWFRHVGNNLEVSVIGTSNKAVIKDWYSASAMHVERIKTVDGAKTLLDSKVENLVTAMASLTPPPLGQTTLTTAQHSQLGAIIAVSWG